MELTSEQAEMLRKVAFATGMHLTKGNHWAAEEMAQDAIAKLLELDGSVAERALPAYIRKTVFNAYINRFNKIRHRGGPSFRVEFFTEFEELLSTPMLAPSPSNIVIRREDQAEARERYQDAVASLTDKERVMLYLAYGIEMSTAEIAELMEYKSAKVVATKLGQIRAKLAGGQPPTE